MMKNYKSCFMLFILALMPYWSYSQLKETECLGVFNSLIYENLLFIDPSGTDLSSENIRLVFELKVLDDGTVVNAILKQSNLSSFNINESDLLFRINGIKIPYLRDMSFMHSEIPPDRMCIIYNSHLLSVK